MPDSQPCWCGSFFNHTGLQLLVHELGGPVKGLYIVPLRVFILDLDLLFYIVLLVDLGLLALICFCHSE